MTTVILDPDLSRRIRRYRRRRDIDHWDECWNGVYFITEPKDNEHQELIGGLTFVLSQVVPPAAGRVFPGINVSDRRERWKKNYRCPDAAVYLNGNPAENLHTHWYGGPDLVIEIVSPGDRSRLKLDFYASVRTREVLILDRDPWRLELFRFQGTSMVPVGASTVESDQALRTESVPFTWRLVSGAERPKVEIAWTETGQRWAV